MTLSYDVAIIGGGIAGLACASTISQAGYRVILLERDHFGEATSANSHRIIHGGFRYLKNFHFIRTYESSNALRQCVQKYSDCVEFLPCLMPLSGSGLQSWWPVTAATALYNVVFGARLKLARCVTSSFVMSEARILASLAGNGALLWHDGLLTEHKKLIGHLVTEARKVGSELFEKAPVQCLTYDRNEWLIECDMEPNRELKARVVINAAGPWIDQISGAERGTNDWCVGYNLVLKRSLPSQYAIGVPSSKGRLFFFVPRSREQCAVGTGYFPVEKVDDHPHVPEETISEFIEEARDAFPAFPIGRDDVQSVEAGYLPTKPSRTGDPELLGLYRIKEKKGYIRLLSTKYTTFLPQSEQVLRLVKQII